MSSKCKFRDYKQQLHQPDSTSFALSEPLRLFIWSLVQSLHQQHDTEKCPKEISAETVVVYDVTAFIIGDCDDYSDELALRNYSDLHSFLKNELFVGHPDLPYCITHFMGLLLDKPLHNKQLIGWHIGILVTTYQISLINNIVCFTSAAEPPFRGKIWSAIDSLTVPANWEKVFMGGERDKVLEKKFLRTGTKDSKKKSTSQVHYESVDPTVRAYALLEFHNDCVTHSGVLKRPPFDNAWYTSWLDSEKIEGPPREKLKTKWKRACTGPPIEPDTDLNDMIKRLFVRFPNFLTDLQKALHDQGLLHIVSPNPCMEM